MKRFKFSGMMKSSNNYNKLLDLYKKRFSSKEIQVPDACKVLIIGGGIIGSSIAYHLAKMGLGKDKNGVVLLEQNTITSGTTWHAAGLMETFGSLNETTTRIRQYSRDLYASLESETGVSTGWVKTGFIELAANKDRLEEYRRVAAFNRLMGVNVEEISPTEIKNRFPLCKTDDLVGGFWVEQDGRVNPVDVTMSLIKGANMHGAKIIENTKVKDILTDNNTHTGNRKNFVKGVVLDNGKIIKAEYVVNCTGMWARQIGDLNGVAIPNQAAEHYYLITEKIEGIDKNWPVIEDPESYCYVRPEGDGLMIGLFEPQAAAWNVGSIPNNESYFSLTPDWERMEPFLKKAMDRVPITNNTGIKTFFCGPESFTPDLSPIIGESIEIRNYFVAAGLNSIGIISGGGIGRMMAHWIINGYPDMDICAVNIDRFHPYQTTPNYRDHRVVESLGMVYKCHYPSLSLKTARNVKKSPIHHRLEEKNAYFRDVSGWESPGWYVNDGESKEIKRNEFWGRENWFKYWESEHHACRNNVSLIEMSFMSKFLVQGKEAGKVLNYMSTSNVDKEINKIHYTQWLNDQGLLEADVTVMKLSPVEFIVIGNDNTHRHVEKLIKRQIEDMDANATCTDITNSYVKLNIQGPNSRKFLQGLTKTDISNEGLPFRGVKDIDIGYCWVKCVRITYVGELGYELYIPSEFAVHVYDKIIEYDQKNNLKLTHTGLRALGSLRMEKGYRDYGNDLDNTDSIWEAGLSFTCDFNKEGGFKGMDKCLKQKTDKRLLKRKLVQVLLKDSTPLLNHSEVVWRNDIRVGNIRSASYGHTLGGAVGLSMIDMNLTKEDITLKEFVEKGKWEVEIGNKKYPSIVSLKPLYDPSNLKIKI